MTPVFSLRSACDFAWNAFRKNPGILIGSLLAIGGGWVAVEVIVITTHRFGYLPWTVWHLAYLLFFAGIWAGLLRIGLMIHDGEKPTFGDIFQQLPRAHVHLTAGLICIALVLGGLILLIFPGIHLGLKYSQVGFCLLEDKIRILDGFKSSGVLVHGHLRELLPAYGFLLLLNLVGASVLGIGLFVTVPVAILIRAALYRQLATRRV